MPPNIPIEDPNDDFFLRLLKKKQEETPHPNNTNESFDGAEKLIKSQTEYIRSTNEKIKKIYSTMPDIEDMDTSDKLLNSIESQMKKLYGLQKKNKIISDTNRKTIEEYSGMVNTTLLNLQKNLRVHLLGKNASRAFDTSDMMIDKASSVFTSITERTEQLSSFAFRTIVKGLNFAKTALGCVTDFLLGPFKLGWKIVDKFLTSIAGPLWVPLKSLVGSGFRIVSWVAGIGKTALQYIWSGVSTVFKIGFKAISQTASLVTKGVKSFFGWWFKLLFNTIFNPAMWIINIPLFVGISSVIFTAVGTLVTASGGLFAVALDNLIPRLMNVAEVIGGWVWSGVQSFFGWLNKQYQSSWFQKFFNYVWSTMKNTLTGWFGGNQVAVNFFNWIYDAYQWVKENSSGVIQWVAEKIDNVRGYIRSTPSKTLLGAFVKWLEPYAGKIPGLQIGLDLLQQKFGFVLSGTTEAIRGEIQRKKEDILRETLATNIYELQTKGLSQADIEKALNNTVSQLQPTIVGDVSADVLKRIKSEAYLSAQKGPDALVGKKHIDRQLKELAKMLNLDNTIKFGGLNALDPSTIESINNRLSASMLVTRTPRNKEKYDGQIETQGLIAHLRNVSDNINTSRLALTLPEYFQQNSDLLTSSTNTDRYLSLSKAFTNTVLATPANWLGYDVKATDYFEMDRNAEGVNKAIIQGDEAVNSANKQRFAHGGIVAPKEINNVIPLNAIGREYIRSRISDIKIPEADKINKKEDAIRNITIIEETTIQHDSYELYTMSQIAKGILGAN
jgi:hypothetical protein